MAIPQTQAPNQLLKPRASGIHRSIALLLCIALCPLWQGCSFFRSGTEVIRIRTEPGAMVFVDGEPVGVVTEVELNRSQSHTIRVKLGDRGGMASVQNTVSGAGVADTIIGYSGFFLIVTLPWLLGTFSDGYWDLEPDSVIILLPAPKTEEDDDDE